jgi:hypothetical protein
MCTVPMTNKVTVTKSLRHNISSALYKLPITGSASLFYEIQVFGDINYIRSENTNYNYHIMQEIYCTRKRGCTMSTWFIKPQSTSIYFTYCKLTVEHNNIVGLYIFT